MGTIQVGIIQMGIDPNTCTAISKGRGLHLIKINICWPFEFPRSALVLSLVPHDPGSQDRDLSRLPFMTHVHDIP